MGTGYQEYAPREQNVLSELVVVTRQIIHSPEIAFSEEFTSFQRQSFIRLQRCLENLRDDPTNLSHRLLSFSQAHNPKLEFYLQKFPDVRLSVTVKNEGLSLAFDEESTRQRGKYFTRVGMKFTKNSVFQEGEKVLHVIPEAFVFRKEIPVYSANISPATLDRANAFFASLVPSTQLASENSR